MILAGIHFIKNLLNYNDFSYVFKLKSPVLQQLDNTEFNFIIIIIIFNYKLQSVFLCVVQ